MRASEILRAGRGILDEVMTPHGFLFAEGPAGQSSGGDYASGEYAKEDRRLEFHFRHSLGLVTYHVGPHALAHDAYMRALLGKGGGNKYPGFSDDPLDGFRHLAYDLAHFCDDFLTGDGEEFRRCASEVEKRGQAHGSRVLPA